MTEKDPHGLGAHTPGSKLDAGKMRPWLCISGFSRALTAVADVTTKGAAKYTPDGWKDVQDGPSRYMDAFGRHMLALGRGELVDQDTGCRHKAQMIWNLLASLELELEPAESTKFSAEFTKWTKENGLQARFQEKSQQLNKPATMVRNSFGAIDMKPFII